MCVPGSLCLAAAPRREEARPLRPLHLPGTCTVSSSWIWPESGTWLSRACGGWQDSGEESLAGPTKKLPVTMGPEKGSAVEERVV